jgi:hypothetical protein
MKRTLTVAAAAMLLTACNDNPVAPAATPAPPVSSKPSLSSGASAAAVDFTDLTNDMVGRLLPSFDDQQTAQAIETSMRALNAHALAGELADARTASQTIRAALQNGVASALLLDVMNRTLDVVDRDLAAAAPSSGDLTLAP